MTLNDTPQHGELLQQNLHSAFELYEALVTQMLLSHVDAQYPSLDFSGVGRPLSCGISCACWPRRRRWK